MDHPAEIKNHELIQSLKELAMDLHWSWNHATDKIWRQLDPVLWELTCNPLVVLQTVSQDRINEVLNDPMVRGVVEDLVEVKRQRSLVPAWFQKTYPVAPLTHIAYFSMEFMLSEALPIYSGGLGNVSGDLLKTASDLGVPLIGIGLLYQQGYPRQVIYKDGTQQYISPYNDPGQLPVEPLRYPNGEWIRIQLQMPGYAVWLRTWKVQVGRTMLLLLDSNDAANFPVHRGITAELYGGDAKIRLMQEIVLGIGGWKLLKALGIAPEICHLNEGHSAFVILERAADFMQANNQPFEIALNATRAGNIFTTHTAVGAGFDLFPPALMEQYLGDYIKKNLGIPFSDFLALGRKNTENENEPFNTAYLAVNGSGSVNGVSRLHGQVSWNLFSTLFPRWPLEEIPVGSVTNGVHMPTWDSPEADKLWTEACGKERWLGTLDNIGKNISAVPVSRLWSVILAGKRTFIEYIRKRYVRQLATIGESVQTIADAGGLFDPNILIMGFARRFAGYKRPGMLLSQPERLCNILLSYEKPVQLVLAGKAHPGDLAALSMIREWIQFINQFDLKHRVIFLSDYDMMLTEQMVHGVDVWINTPSRPWEACGTSGMKVLVNGGINVSELDGWWDEAYDPGVGWALGDRADHNHDPVWEKAEAKQLYDLLENEIIPEFYDRNADGIPEKWVHRMRNSMARLTPQFSSNRSLKEYTEKYYLPSAARYNERKEKRGQLSRQLVEWKNSFGIKWKGVHFTNIRIDTTGDRHHFIVHVFMNRILPGEITVALYAEAMNGKQSVRQIMQESDVVDSDIASFTADVHADRPAMDYTPRIFPKHAGLSIPLECNYILWYH